MSFAKYEWWTNFHCNLQTGPYEPINNVGQIWDPKLVTVDGEGLHLQIAKCSPDFPQPTPWCSTEAVLMQQTGFGRYLVTVKGDGFNIAELATGNPAMVAGAFTYQVEKTSSSNPQQELDTFEIGKLQATDSTNAQFTLQPAFAAQGNLHRITLDPSQVTGHGDLVTFVMDWKGAGSATFAAYYGAHTLGSLPAAPDISWTPGSAQAPYIPADACQHFHLNFWQFAEHAQGPRSVIVTHFEFQAH